MKMFLVLALLVGGARADLFFMERRELPLTTVNVTFRVGSADDPEGKYGLAFLVGRLLREGGVKKWNGQPALSRSEMEEVLFPMGAEIGVSVGREQTSFTLTAPAEYGEKGFGLLVQTVLAPQFDAQEMSRLKDEATEALQKRLPREDQEELGKAALSYVMYGKKHPYGHVVEGTLAGVKNSSEDDVTAFYQQNFTKKRVVVGVAGVISPALKKAVQIFHEALPAGKTDRAVIPAPELPAAPTLTIVKGPFQATGVHVGQPINVVRGGDEFPEMYLASMGFGKHRSFVGRLMNVVREVRGLNYGAYSYVEEFPYGGQRLSEPNQAALSRQAFTVWGRPTPLPNGCFLTRQIAREVQSLRDAGLTDKEFDLTKSHLLGIIPLLAPSLERQLGYRADSRFYGIVGDYLNWLSEKVRSVDRKKVNVALKTNLNPAKMHFVVVTPDPDKFKEEILGKKCDIQYAQGITKPREVLQEDRRIAGYSPGFAADKITVVDSETIFQ